MPPGSRPGPGRRRCRASRRRSRRRGRAVRGRGGRGCAPPEAPSGWPIAIAPPRMLTRSGSSSGQPRDAGERLRGERLVELDRVDPRPSRCRRARAPCWPPRPARCRRRPDRRRGRRSRRRGRAGRGRAARPARSSPSSSMLAPSMSGEELPAVTVPPSTNAGASSRELLERGVGADALVALERRRPAPARPRAITPSSKARAARRWLRSANSSWASREIAVDRRQLLGARAERDRPLRGHQRVDHAPAERRRVQRLVAGRVRARGLAQHPRRARHRLDAAGDDERRVAAADRPARLDRRLEARAAEPVDGRTGDASSAGRRAAPPSARRCGCPRRRRWRARGSRRRSPPGRGSRRARAARAARARRDRRGARRRARRRSGRTASAPPRR